MNHSITLTLIVKNEESNIQKCFSPFLELGIPIVVVDTGSTDDTVEMCKNLGAKVLSFEWIDDFSAARNFALSQVTTEWVIMMDADERISLKDLELVLSSLTADIDLLKLRVQYGETSTYISKVWRKALGLKYKYPVHEFLDYEQEIRIMNLEVAIDRPRGENTVSSRAYYIEIMKNYLSTHPTDQRMLYYLISDCRFLGRHKEAVQFGQTYLNTNPENNFDVARVLRHIGLSLEALGQTKEAIQAFEGALQFNPHHQDSLMSLAQLFEKLKNQEAAIQSYQKLIDVADKNKDYGFSTVGLVAEAKEALNRLKKL